MDQIKELALEEYAELKRRLTEQYQTIAGELVPNEDNDIEEIHIEIQELEDRFPEINFE